MSVRELWDLNVSRYKCSSLTSECLLLQEYAASQFQCTKQSDKNIRKCVTISPPPPKKTHDPTLPPIFNHGITSRFFYIYFSTNAIVGVSCFDLKGSTHHWFYANCSNLMGKKDGQQGIKSNIISIFCVFLNYFSTDTHNCKLEVRKRARGRTTNPVFDSVI